MSEKKTENEFQKMLGDLVKEEVPDVIEKLDTIAEDEGIHYNYDDFVEMKNECQKDALIIIGELSEFYISKQMLENKYIRAKIKDDIETIAKILFQIKTAEHAVIRCLEQIEIRPQARTFEVLSMCQKSQMELQKQYEMTKIIIENNYKVIKNDYDILVEEGIQKILPNNNVKQISENSISQYSIEEEPKSCKDFLKEIRSKKNIKD